MNRITHIKTKMSLTTSSINGLNKPKALPQVMNYLSNVQVVESSPPSTSQPIQSNNRNKDDLWLNIKKITFILVSTILTISVSLAIHGRNVFKRAINEAMRDKKVNLSGWWRQEISERNLPGFYHIGTFITYIQKGFNSIVSGLIGKNKSAYRHLVDETVQASLLSNWPQRGPQIIQQIKKAQEIFNLEKSLDLPSHEKVKA